MKKILLMIAMLLQTAGASYASDIKGIEFVPVKGGCYDIGREAGEKLKNAVPAQKICVDDFNVGKYEVTQSQWRSVMNNDPFPMSANCDACPVVNVSWNDAKEFTHRLSEQTGKVFRLPTEAEWEYVARKGGVQTETRPTEQHELQPVTSSTPNGLGVHNMQGSVWEWTLDKYKGGQFQVLRGGSWMDKSRTVQSVDRIKYEPWIKRTWIGFRVVSPNPL